MKTLEVFVYQIFTGGDMLIIRWIQPQYRAHVNILYFVKLYFEHKGLIKGKEG